VLGARRSLLISVAAAALAFVVFGLAAARSRWSAAELWRWLLVIAAGLAWAIVLISWLLRVQRMSPAQHQRGMYRALAAWAITDLAVVLAWST
jgi:hypothetical protein